MTLVVGGSDKIKIGEKMRKKDLKKEFLKLIKNKNFCKKVKNEIKEKTKLETEIFFENEKTIIKLNQRVNDKNKNIIAEILTFSFLNFKKLTKLESKNLEILYLLINEIIKTNVILKF